MPAATAEKPKRMVSKPTADVLYLARRKDLRLVIERKEDIKDAGGNVVRTNLGKRIAFSEGVLRVPARGQMRGEAGEVLAVDEVMAFLEGDEETGKLAHHLFGDRFEGFWRQDMAPPAPTQAERDTLLELAMDLDETRLLSFIAQEEEGWARPELLESAASTLERVRAKLAEPPPAPEAPADTKG